MQYSILGLTDLLHRLGFTYQLTTPVPCRANVVAQIILIEKPVDLEAKIVAGGAVLYYADAAYPTHHTRCTCA